MALAAPTSALIGRNEREGASAYDAGHTAGRALATTHHTAAPPKNAGDDFTTQLLTLLGHNTGPTPAQLALQAKQLAASDVASQVAAYRQQQTDLTNQAASRAAQINAATLAASKYLYGPAGGNTVADDTSASFNNAAKTEAAIAGGYSGQLRQTATDEAAKVQAGLDAIGAPAGQAPSSTQGQDLSNVLYGLGGQIPSNVLVTAGQGAADAARFLPGATLGYGAGEANLARSAGASAAAGLLPDIRNTISQQPKLAQQYLSSLGTQADNAQSRQQSALALASLIQNRGDAQVRADAPKAPKTFGGAKTGYYTIDPNGTVTQVTPPVATIKGATAKKPPSVAARKYANTEYGAALTGITAAKTGVPVKSLSAAFPVSPTALPGGWTQLVPADKNTGAKPYYINHYPPLTYAQAIAEGVKAGHPPGLVVKAANKIYGTPAQQKAAAAQARARGAKVLAQTQTAADKRAAADKKKLLASGA